MNLSFPAISIGWVIALLVLIFAVVFSVTDEINDTVAILIGALAVARMT